MRIAPLLLLACVHPAAAWAAPSPAALSWVRVEGAEGCVGAPELARSVEVLLGRPVFVVPSAATLSVEGRVERAPGPDPVWRAVVRVSDAAGEVLGDRVIESRAPTCDELGRVVAVTLALLIDPEGAAAPPVEAAAAPPVEGVAPPVEAVAPPPTAAVADAGPPVGWHVGGEGALGGGLGLVPGVAVAGVGTVRVRPPGRVSYVARGELVPFARTGDGGTDLLRASGGLGVCPALVDRARVRLDACAGVDAGAVFVLRSEDAPDATERVLVDARGGLGIHAPVLGPLGVYAGAWALVPLRRVVFRAADAAGTTIWAAPAVGAALDLGFAVWW